jgi:ribosomal protein S18 acetylase RimI-like enzyme
VSERTLRIRAATDSDVDAIVGLVNRAYEVESFFVKGDRATRESVAIDLTQGSILVADDAGGKVVACVFVSITGARGYFGMLAVAPEAQGHGLGRALIARAEGYAADRGANVMTISVVNVRTELLAFYARLGYRAYGEAPYVHRPVLQAVHFVLMEKTLQGSRG